MAEPGSEVCQYREAELCYITNKAKLSVTYTNSFTFHTHVYCALAVALLRVILPPGRTLAGFVAEGKASLEGLT